MVCDRGFEFICIVFSKNINLIEEFVDFFCGFYSEIFMWYYSFLVKCIFSVVMGVCLYCKDFYVKFGDDE